MTGFLRTISDKTVKNPLFVAYLALFVAFTGGTAAYAAATIGSADIIDESILSRDIKNGTVKGIDVGDNSITGQDVNESTLAGGDAATVGGMSVKKINFRANYGTAKTVVLYFPGKFRLWAECQNFGDRLDVNAETLESGDFS